MTPPHSVTTITPLRISFAGGGTDLAGFYREHGGGVVSSAIDKFIYVTVKRHSELFNEAYRLNYSKAEHTDNLDALENDIARECLKLVPVEPPLFVSTIADLPTSSGLGSSSSFAVGLLYALHLMRGENPSPIQLAEEACQVEIERLQRPIGKQDQYAAAFGGLHYFSFESDGRVILEPISVNGDLFSDSLLFYTGRQRNAADILTDQKANIKDTIPALIGMRDQAEKLRYFLKSGGADDPVMFGAFLNGGWNLKRKLSTGISSPEIDAAYERAMNAGALGGKIAGAGGGRVFVHRRQEGKAPGD